MSKHYEQNAEHVVAGFKEVLSPKARDLISDESYSELSMLIESAISTAVLSAVEAAADEMESLAQRVRKGAERYDGG